MENMATFRAITRQFDISGAVCSIEPLTSGHINSTYCVKTDDAAQYTLQRINQYVFHDPAAVMENILHVTAHIKKSLAAEGADVARESLTVILTRDGLPYYLDEDGEYWRLYRYIGNAHTLNFVQDPKQLYDAGFGFGRFQCMLSDFPIDTLHETIPDFHNTRLRYAQLMEAYERDVCGRAKDVAPDVEFFRARAEELSLLVAMTERGELPLRVTHNDTKFNNILLDDETGAALSVIDLDTVMPGLLVNDFGDAIRYAANTAEEDETDLARVGLDLAAYQHFADGFLTALRGRITPKEFEMLPWGAKIITMELAMRFLADHLNGDRYFKIQHENHNLERARCQIRLAQSMEEQFDEMVRRIAPHRPV